MTKVQYILLGWYGTIVVVSIHVLWCYNLLRCFQNIINKPVSTFNNRTQQVDKIMTEARKFAPFKRGVIDIIALLLFCGTRISNVSAYRNACSAFVSHNSVVVRSVTAAYAAPGMSDERRKQERDSEIRSKIAKLKREGKIKNKDGTRSAEDSAMLEAEAFFNRSSPVRKFEHKLAERKRLASLAEGEATDEEEKGINDR